VSSFSLGETFITKTVVCGTVKLTDRCESFVWTDKLELLLKVTLQHKVDNAQENIPKTVYALVIMASGDNRQRLQKAPLSVYTEEVFFKSLSKKDTER